MIRRLFTLAWALSLLLCAAAAWLWWHSRRVFVDRAQVALGRAYARVASDAGGLWVEAGTGSTGWASWSAGSSAGFTADGESASPPWRPGAGYVR
jgi:hypothetical protein